MEQKTQETTGKTLAKERALQANCWLKDTWSHRQGNAFQFETVVKEMGLGASLLKNKLSTEPHLRLQTSSQ